MSRKPKGRAIDGMLLLDKGPGMTSNGAVQRVKRLFQAQKAGHTGSLDPIATGLLPICLGEATKFSGFLLDTDKRYRVLARLGKTTATADSEGEILEERSGADFFGTADRRRPAGLSWTHFPGSSHVFGPQAPGAAPL